MSKIERVDKEVGSGSSLITAGSYKDAEDNTRYKFGIRVSVPTKEEMGQELWDKFAGLGIHRAMSVDAAGTFNKANDFGTEEMAQAYAERWSSVEGCEKAFEKTRREGAGARVADPAITILADALRQASKNDPDRLTNAKVPIPRLGDEPKTEKGQINFNAWAKVLKAEEHPWYKVAVKKAQDKKGFE